MERPSTQYAGIAGQSHLLAPPRLLRRVKANLKVQLSSHAARPYLNRTDRTAASLTKGPSYFSLYKMFEHYKRVE